MDDLESKWGKTLTAADKVKLDGSFWEAHRGASSGISKFATVIRTNDLLKDDAKVKDLLTQVWQAFHKLEDELDDKYK